MTNDFDRFSGMGPSYYGVLSGSHQRSCSMRVCLFTVSNQPWCQAWLSGCMDRPMGMEPHHGNYLVVLWNWLGWTWTSLGGHPRQHEP